MPAASIDEIAALLAESLGVWHLDGRVVVDGGTLTVRVGDRSARIGAPPEGAPFRWMVATTEKTRGVVSLSALLRTVRNVLDPDHAGVRLRLAPQGVLPP